MSWNPDLSQLPQKPGARIRIQYADGFATTTILRRKADGVLSLVFCDRKAGDPERCLTAVTGWYELTNETALSRRAKERMRRI